jgi:hypothetical protein
VLKVAFGAFGLGELQLGEAELDPAKFHIGAKCGVDVELACGIGWFFILKVETAEVVVSDGKIAIEREGMEIRARGRFMLAGAMIGQAKVIPRLGVGGKELNGLFKAFNRLGEALVADQAFAFEEGGRPGRGATAQDKGEERQPEALKSKPKRPTLQRFLVRCHQ